MDSLRRASGVVALGFLFACAKGSAADTGFDDLTSGDSGTGTGMGGSGQGPATSTTHATTATTTHATTSTTTTSSGVGGFGGGFGGGTASSTGGFGGTTSSSASSSSSSGGGNCGYTSPNTCEGAQELATINGDTDNDTRIESGETSMWYQVVVYENSSSPFSFPSLSYTASLDVPAGMDFELFAYRSGSADTPDCLASPVQGTGPLRQIHESWGDTPGSDDTEVVSFEVRYISGGACGIDAQWTLTIQGDT